MRRWYGLVVLLQYGFIVLTCIVCLWLVPSASKLVLIIITLINGLHFLALGPILRWSAYAKGIILCLLAILTAVALPTSITVGGAKSYQILLWFVVPGFGTTIVVWSDAILSLVGVIHVLRRYTSPEKGTINSMQIRSQ